MTRSEIIELVRRVIDAAGNEEELDACISAVSAAVPHPRWTDLIFFDDRELSPEEVVEEALAYRAIRSYVRANQDVDVALER